MATKLEEDIIAAKSYWQTICASTEEAPSVVDATTKAIIDFAIPVLEKATVKNMAQEDHSALKYAMLVYCEADRLVNEQNNPVLSNHLACCALMVALEECYYRHCSYWSYGSRLLFDFKQHGINLKRTLTAAFLAQEGTWNTNKSKGNLLDGNIVAVGTYCARLKVLCYTLAGNNLSMGGTEEALEKIEVGQELKSPSQILGYYLNEFAVPYLEAVGSAAAREEVAAFQSYLSEWSDFYVAPCSTKYHLCRDQGLVEHTIHVLMQMLWLTLPATRQQLGACVLAAIGHDLCKCNVYRKQYKPKKVYLNNGEEAPAAAFIKEDAGGRFYWADSWYYEFSDAMPFGHGRKSAHMLLGFFPKLGADVYSAVDGHMGDPDANSNYMALFAENPLALNLHIADVLATYIDEHEKK